MNPTTGTKLGVNPVRTTPEGSTNSDVLPPFFVTPLGKRPSHFQPITTLSPFASGKGGVKTYRCRLSSGVAGRPFMVQVKWSQSHPPVSGI